MNSHSGGNFDNLIDKQLIGRFLHSHVVKQNNQDSHHYHKYNLLSTSVKTGPVWGPPSTPHKISYGPCFLPSFLPFSAIVLVRLRSLGEERMHCHRAVKTRERRFLPLPLSPIPQVIPEGHPAEGGGIQIGREMTSIFQWSHLQKVARRREARKKGCQV